MTTSDLKWMACVEPLLLNQNTEALKGSVSVSKIWSEKGIGGEVRTEGEREREVKIGDELTDRMDLT
jgi:hypothetical protein